MTQQDARSFEDLKTRLDEIVALVSDDSLPLDEALDLYEEAVGIGLSASRIMEEGIAVENAQVEESSHESNLNDSTTDQVSSDAKQCFCGKIKGYCGTCVIQQPSPVKASRGGRCAHGTHSRFDRCA